MKTGGIFLLRKIRDNPLWNDKPFTKGQAWVDMLLQANWKDADVLYDQEVYHIKRGQFIRSERQLAADWGWSRSKVTRFLRLLQKCFMIEKKPNPKANQITILNYNQLQKIRTNSEPIVNQYRTNSEPKQEGKEGEEEEHTPNNPSRNGRCPYTKMVEIYHKILPELSEVRKLTDIRKKQARKIWMDEDMAKDLEKWQSYCQHIRKSKFLMGASGKWQADFEWITNYNNFTKIIEGKYHN